MLLYLIVLVSAVSLVSLSISLLLCIKRTSVRSNEGIRTRENLAYSTHSSPGHHDVVDVQNELDYDYIHTDRFIRRAQTDLTTAGPSATARNSAIQRSAAIDRPAGGSVKLMTSNERKADFEDSPSHQ